MSPKMPKNSTMDNLEEVRHLGRGSFGEVVLARHPVDGKLFAVKHIRCTELTNNEIAEQCAEVRALQKLNHPFVLRYFDSMEDEDSLRIITEYADAGDLRQLLRSRSESGRPFEAVTCFAMFAQLAMALEHVHSHRVVHRDLKPENVFLTSGGHVKIGDFGVAKVLSGTTMNKMTCVGSPFYMAPEVLGGEACGPPCDVWSLGVIFYEVCSFRKPFEGQSLGELVVRISSGKYESLRSKLERELADAVTPLIDQMLLLDHKARSNMTEVVRSRVLAIFVASLCTCTTILQGAFKEQSNGDDECVPDTKLSSTHKSPSVRDGLVVPRASTPSAARDHVTYAAKGGGKDSRKNLPMSRTSSKSTTAGANTPRSCCVSDSSKDSSKTFVGATDAKVPTALAKESRVRGKSQPACRTPSKNTPSTPKSCCALKSVPVGRVCSPRMNAGAYPASCCPLEPSKTAVSVNDTPAPPVLTKESRIKAVFFGSLVADALALGCHYEYDAKLIKKACGGMISRYMAPAEGYSQTYHPGQQAGDQTDYGEYTVVILEHLAKRKDAISPISLNELVPHWKKRLESPTWGAWKSSATKYALQQLNHNMLYDQLGHPSAEMAIRHTAVHAIFADEEDVVTAARAVMFTHSHKEALGCSEFFARVTHKIIYDKFSPREAIEATAKMMGKWYIDKISLAIAKVEEATDPSQPLYEEEFVDDLAVLALARRFAKASVIEGTLPASVYFILKYQNDFEAGVKANAMIGGDSGSRAIAVGMVLGAWNGLESIPKQFQNSLNAWGTCDDMLASLPLLKYSDSGHVRKRSKNVS